MEKRIPPRDIARMKAANLGRMRFRRSKPAVNATRQALKTNSIKDHSIAEERHWAVSKVLRDFDWRYRGFSDTSTAAKRDAFEKKACIHNLHTSLAFYHGNMRNHLTGLKERTKAIQRRKQNEADFKKFMSA